jgi:hypothetical protein
MIRKKPALGLYPMVETGFPPSRSSLWRAKEGPKRPCSNEKPSQRSLRRYHYCDPALVVTEVLTQVSKITSEISRILTIGG